MLESHPVADIFPLMSDSEFKQLCADIREHGLREPIWKYDGKIIDGRNRYNACLEVDVAPRFNEYSFDPANLLSFVVSLNLYRRHLSESQRAMVAAKIANLRDGQRAASIEAPVTQTEAAEMLNVSRASVQRAEKVQNHGVTELAEQVEAGELSVSQAARIAELPKGKQKRLIRKGRKSGAKVLTDMKINTLKKVKSNDSVCLLCNPDNEADEKSVSAFMQLLARQHPKYARYFLAVADEIEESDLSDVTIAAREKITRVIAGGFQTQADIQKRTGLDAKVLEHTLAVMLDYGQIVATEQGGKTDGARGARKTLYVLNENAPASYQHDDDEDEVKDYYYGDDDDDSHFAALDALELDASYPA